MVGNMAGEDEEREWIQSMKEFIENPNADNAVKVANRIWCINCVCDMIGVWENKACFGCVWHKVVWRKTKEITEEMLSVMLLDVIQMLAACETSETKVDYI